MAGGRSFHRVHRVLKYRNAINPTNSWDHTHSGSFEVRRMSMMSLSRLTDVMTSEETENSEFSCDWRCDWQRKRKVNQIIKSYFLSAAVSSIVRVLNKWISLKVWSRLCMTSRDKPLLAKKPAGITKDVFEMVLFGFFFFFVGCNDVNSVTNTLFGVKVAVNDPFLCNQRHFKKQAGILVMVGCGFNFLRGFKLEGFTLLLTDFWLLEVGLTIWLHWWQDDRPPPLTI